jgi:hypothetical protein
MMDFLFGGHNNIDELYQYHSRRWFSVNVCVFLSDWFFVKKVRKKCAKMNIKIAAKQ